MAVQRGQLLWRSCFVDVLAFSSQFSSIFYIPAEIVVMFNGWQISEKIPRLAGTRNVTIDVLRLAVFDQPWYSGTEPELRTVRFTKFTTQRFLTSRGFAKLGQPRGQAQGFFFRVRVLDSLKSWIIIVMLLLHLGVRKLRGGQSSAQDRAFLTEGKFCEFWLWTTDCMTDRVALFFLTRSTGNRHFF